MRANGHDRHRNDTNLQDVRVGRHRDKLELIRDSLRPFEQAVNEVPTSGTDQATTSAVGDPSAYSPGFEQQRAMVDSLIAQGYEQDAAYYALKLVKFASPEAAIDVLKHINHDHANMEETKNERVLSVLPTGANAMNGNLLVQTSRGSNGASNGNLYPIQFATNVEDSASSRSTSPLPPQMPSPSGAPQQFTTSAGGAPSTTSSYVSMAVSPSTTSSPHSVSSGAQTTPSAGQMPASSQSPHKALRRQYTPVAPDYHRTHVHISTTPYKPDPFYQQSRQQQPNYKPSIFIERAPERPSGVMKHHYVVRDTFKSPLDASISAPMGQSTSHVQIGGMPSHMGRYSQQPSHPVIRTTFSAAPLKSMVNINVSPINKNTETRTYRLDVSGRDGVSSVHGVPGSMTGVQNIIVDPDKTHRGFVGYEDELRPKHPCADGTPSTSKDPGRHERLDRSYGLPHGSSKANLLSLQSPDARLRCRNRY